MPSKKYILGALVLLLLLSQIPFACRRYKLRRLNTAIQQLNSQRTAYPGNNAYVEYKGVVHVHSFLGGHSEGTFGEIISAARSNGLHFVVMTEHTEKEFDTAAMTLKGLHGGVLFINGNEVSSENGDRLLVLPGEVSIAAYPEDFKNWDTPRLDGIEIYNVFTNSGRINPLVAFFDVVWSQRAYPELIFALYLERPELNLQKWDQSLTRRRLAAIAGNDAHSNIGVSLKDSSGNTLLGIKLDPYETSFRLVRTHVLIKHDQALNAESLMEAIRAGHSFVGFDVLGDTTGFVFEAETPSGLRIQGDEILLNGEIRMRVRTPVPGRIVIFRDGAVFQEESGISSKDIVVTERGIYRVEVYLPQLGSIGAEKPWIISNPIYVR
jgi:hypothetical protein